MTSSTNSNEHAWAAGCHLASLVGLIVPIIGNIIGPLIVWSVKRDSSKLVDSQGKESMNFQISILVYSAILTLVLGATVIPTILTGGLLLVATIPIAVTLYSAIGLFEIVMVIVAAISSANGNDYHYPLTIRFIN